MLIYLSECDRPSHVARTRPPGLGPVAVAGNRLYQSSAVNSHCFDTNHVIPCSLPKSIVYTRVSGAAHARSAHSLLPQLPIYGSACHPQPAQRSEATWDAALKPRRSFNPWLLQGRQNLRLSSGRSGDTGNKLSIRDIPGTAGMTPGTPGTAEAIPGIMPRD